MILNFLRLIVFIVSCSVFLPSAYGQSSEFAFQGRLTDAGVPVATNYDLRFTLFGEAVGGTPIGTIERTNVSVSNGVFTVKLDFGAAAFDGSVRYIETEARPTGGGSYASLSPRVQVVTVPYAVRSLNSAQLGGVAADQYVTTTSGQTNFIRNSTTQQTGSFNIAGTGQATAFSAATEFRIGSEPVLRTPGVSNVFLGGAGSLLDGGSNNVFIGRFAGNENRTGDSNTFVGVIAGNGNVSGSSNTAIGSFARVGSIESPVLNGTAIGAGSQVLTSNTIALGRPSGSDQVIIPGNVGIGTTAPSELLDIATNGSNIVFGSGGCSSPTVAIGLNGPFGSCTNYTLRGSANDVLINRPTGGTVSFREGNGSSQVVINPGGTFEPRVLGTAGGTALCRNASLEIAFCSSSLRYKKNITPFAPGLSFVNQLRPISYEWTADNNKDVGFGAEDVAKIDTRFVTYNDKGEVEGIKYDRLSVAFVNSFREQQAQIETQQKQITDLLEANRRQQDQIEKLQETVREQQRMIEQLKLIVCSIRPSAEVCSKK